MPDNAIQYNIYNAIQCMTMQYNTIKCNAIQCMTIQYNTIQCNTTQYNMYDQDFTCICNWLLNVAANSISFQKFMSVAFITMASVQEIMKP